MTTIHNVSDRRHGWIGSWSALKMDQQDLVEANIGKTVIYCDASGNVREAGTLVSWNETTVFARFSTGDTAAGCNIDDLWIVSEPLDGDKER